MARIAGVDLPKDKRIETALTYIYGIGPAMAKRILDATRVDPNLRVKALAESDIVQLRDLIERDHVVEGDLRREVTSNIKRLMEIGCYRGLRHRRKLPVRGQRTKTNARTRKGPHRMVIGAKTKKTAPAAPAKA
jgi:small subunit ribosomal protein S13